MGKDWQGELPLHKPLAMITLEEYTNYKDRWLTADKEQIILYHLHDMVDGAAVEGTFLKAYGQYLNDHRSQPATLFAIGSMNIDVSLQSAMKGYGFPVRCLKN